MNPETPSVAGSAAPDEAHAAISPVLVEVAAVPAAPGPTDGVNLDDAPDTVPDQLRELSADARIGAVVPAASIACDEPGTASAAGSAGAPDGSTVPAGPAAASDLSPAATGARLAELFPALFSAAAPGAPGPAKPIKLRIHADIQARAPGVFSKRVLGIFFSRYTTTTAYLKALVNAPQRLDLDGEPAGDISEEHRQLARDELARRQALAAERRAALRPPRRERPPAREGEAAQITAPVVQPDRAASPRPDARTEWRPDNRPPARPPQRPRGDAPRSDALPREHGSARGHDRPPRQDERAPGQPRHADRGPRAEHTPPHPRAPRRDATPEMQRMDAAPALPADPAQRERAMLLRSFESSPLSKANFCALKRITEATLDAVLAQAQAERGMPPPSSIQRRSSR